MQANEAEVWNTVLMNQSVYNHLDITDIYVLPLVSKSARQAVLDSSSIFVKPRLHCCVCELFGPDAVNVPFRLAMNIVSCAVGSSLLDLTGYELHDLVMLASMCVSMLERHKGQDSSIICESLISILHTLKNDTHIAVLLDYDCFFASKYATALQVAHSLCH